MGLDMYLFARKGDFTSRYFNEKEELEYPEELKVFEADLDGVSIETKTDYRIAYWRGASAIHNFFVEYCTSGVNSCKEMSVHEDILQLLLGKIELALSHPQLAEKLLPTHDKGCWGNCDFKEKYFNDLKYTKKVVENAIKLLENEDYEIIYYASW